jgi:hypothetical protein
MPLHYDPKTKTVQWVEKYQSIWKAVVGELNTEYQIYRIRGEQYIIFRDGNILDTKEFLKEIKEEGIRRELQQELGKEILTKIRMQATMEEI